ncbi:hypothetical protein H9P43_005624 [Blastocladiella emersonii ATCC 22665]|nr:hypothetical protein H9P43_005624 [Blastocladiella emersonii ATCC 22665]
MSSQASSDFVPDVVDNVAPSVGTPAPHQHRTQQPRPARDYDCLPCRLTGATALGGLAAYAFYSATNAPGAAQLPMNRRVAMGVLGVGFASGAVFRLLF